MKRVLIYSPTHSDIWGGGQIYIEQLCNYMNMNGVETYILCSNPGDYDCPTRPMPLADRKLRRLLHSFKVAGQNRKEGFDCVILNDLSSLWLAPVFKLAGFRVISLLHLYLHRGTERELGYSVAFYHLLRLSSRFCDEMFSVNLENKAVFSNEKVTFVGNYVPTWFVDVPVIVAKQYDFILIARFSVQKNIPLFLRMLYELNRRSDKTYTALLVGKGPERKKILKEIEILGLSSAVTIREWVERRELPSVYDLGRCFVISSHHEGFATTLLEAHARGLPAVVTRSSGFCGTFVEGYNDVTGLVFTPEQLKEDAFYDRLRALIAQAGTYGPACRRKAQAFTPEQVLGPIMEATQR